MKLSNSQMKDIELITELPVEDFEREIVPAYSGAFRIKSEEEISLASFLDQISNEIPLDPENVIITIDQYRLGGDFIINLKTTATRKESDAESRKRRVDKIHRAADYAYAKERASITFARIREARVSLDDMVNTDSDTPIGL
jgi:hypothetical protein